MSNNYVPDEAPLAPGQQAQSSQVNTRYENTVAGFDKLPEPAVGKKGFSTPCPVGTPTEDDHAATKEYADNLLGQNVLDAQTAQAAAEEAQANSELAEGYAAEWANKAEDSLISTEAGGDQVSDYSSRHHANKAFASASEADASKSHASEWANKEEDALISAAAGGDNVNDYSAKHYANKAAASAAAAHHIPYSARNCVLNQDPVSQGESTRRGMESLLGAAATGVDTSTVWGTGGEQFGGLTVSKDRNNATSWVWSDTVIGDNYLSSDSTAAQTATVPAVNADDVTFTFQSTHRHTGTTNRNKAYTAHYNPWLGFSAVGYEGDGVDGHEIPHHLGKASELTIFKNRTDIANWKVSYYPDSIGLNLNDTDAAVASNEISNSSDDVVTIPDVNSRNGENDNIISYHFTSIPGVSKVGKYVGTGAAGNYVDCGFKAGLVMIKNITTGGTGYNWLLFDSIRGGSSRLAVNDSAAENTASIRIDMVDDGFVLVNTADNQNAINDEYIFLAFAETSLDGTKSWTDYPYPTTADTLTINQDSQILFAGGFNTNGPVDSLEVVGAGITHVLGAGHEDQTLYLYKNKDGVYDTTEYRPLVGLTRNTADEWGVESPLDPSLRTTTKHSGYESSTGVALASGESSGYFAYSAFNKVDSPYSSILSDWAVDSATTSWLQYKFTEKRVLKSWRIREASVTSVTPRRFTIEGSDDGLNWTVIDSTYSSSDYLGNGSHLWGDVQDTSANTTSYLYYRINITANNGHATVTELLELEFNTILPSDYYNVQDGVMYDSVGTPIERTYLAKIITDTEGNVASYENFPISEGRLQDAEVFGDLKVRGDIDSKQVVTAWVNFDGTESPPLIRDSYNVSDVVKLNTGSYEVLFETPMNNEDYVITGEASGHQHQLNAAATTIHRARVQSYTDAGNAYGDNVMYIAIIGGK